jgi:hypothetical protein
MAVAPHQARRNVLPGKGSHTQHDKERRIKIKIYFINFNFNSSLFIVG